VTKRWLRISAFPVSFFGLSALSILCGCEQLLDIREYELAERPAEGCSPPSVGDAGSGLRLGHLSPTAGPMDLCAVPRGSSFGNARPLLEWAGSGCSRGVKYKDLSVPLGLRPGEYDVRVVPWGKGCEQPVATATAQKVEAGRTYSVYLFPGEKAFLRVFGDRTARGNTALVRFVNGAVGLAAADCGGEDELEPGMLSSVRLTFEDVPFGGVAAEKQHPTFPIDKTGYLAFVGGAAAWDFAVAEAGEREYAAKLPTQKQFVAGRPYTLFAGGNYPARPGDAHPLDLWVCDESQGDPVRPGLALCGAPEQLTVDVFATQLSDLFTANIDERAPHVIDAIRNMDAELVCLSEVQRPGDVRAAREAAQAAGYTQVVVADDLLAGAAPDLIDESGREVSYEEAECVGDEQDVLEQAASALLDNAHCLRKREDGEHELAVSGAAAQDCLVASAGAELFGKLLDNASDAPAVARRKRRCFFCAMAAFSGYRTIEDTVRVCSAPPANPKNPKELYVFNGSPGLMVLSKLPLAAGEAPELRLLPSTHWQRGILRLPVTAGNGERVDFYCSAVTVIASIALLPYAGDFGGGATDPAQGAENEQRLQAVRSAEFIRQRSSAPNVTVLAGLSLYSGPAYRDPKTQATLVNEYVPSVYEAVIKQGFQPLVAAGYVPSCNVCENPTGRYPHGEENTWTTHLFGRKIPRENVLATELIYTAPVVDTTEGQLSISQHYGLRTEVRVLQ
jgi:hypothetical protein